MTKKGAILTLIIAVLVILNTVLFGFVFRLRNQSVLVVGEDISYTTQQIVDAAGLKNGKSIFLLNKNEAIQNIEQTYADLKVIQIKTTSVTNIEFKVRKRYPTYFIKNLGSFYVLDEELKVLEVYEEESAVGNLIEIKSNLNGLTESSKKTNFIGSALQQNLCYNLYTAIYATQLTSIGQQSHLEMCNLVESVSFDVGYTPDGESFNRLIVKTTEGVTFDIGKADQGLERKINICFATQNELETKTGTITISYSQGGVEQKTYSVGQSQ